MSDEFSIGTFVPALLKEQPEQRLTARELGRLIMQRYPAACEAKRRRSKASIRPLDTQDALEQQIVAEIGAQRKGLERYGVKTTEGRPRKYYFSTQNDAAEVETVEHRPVELAPPQAIQPTTSSEAALYPKLSEFLFHELGIHSKRIDEKRASKSPAANANKWLYPDVVGLEDLTSDWERDIVDCVSASSDTRSKLYSFEVKLLLNRSNVRESFFQTVSNSSWANFAYLVAAEIQNSDTMSELRVLAGTHGIGLIRLDADNPSESDIVIPAKERPSIDWNSANRLAASSSDFTDYLKLVWRFYKTQHINPKEWDYHGN